ncbi:hypothetical protein ASD45_14870 [Pseudolabrys sp. Root1462]|nr:hypothetical protein ASD45_14870 [Pseudolabrys sp. Root1462]
MAIWPPGVPLNIRSSNQEQAEVPAKNGHKPLAESDDSTYWTFASQIAICGIFLIALVAALDLARPVMLPATFALVIGLMLGPLSARADRHGVPTLVTAIVLWLLVLVICYGVIALLATPVLDWIGKAPEIGRIIKARLHFLDGPMSALRDLRSAFLPENERSQAGVDIANFVQPALAIATPALGQTFIFFGMLFFVLLGRLRLRRALVTGFDDHDTRLRFLKIWNAIEHQLTSYLSVVAVINLAVGLGAAAIAFGVGLPNAVAWGVLAFILNFIPYIGALMMQIILLSVGLVTFPTLPQALLAPLLYLAFTTLEGHFITPAVMGRHLTLVPLIVFLSLVFWTWLWGPAGAFLAVPLLIVGLVALQHIFPKDRPALPE